MIAHSDHARPLTLSLSPSGGEGTFRRALALLFIGLVAAAPAVAQPRDDAAASRRGLLGMRRVALDITFSPIHPGVPVEDVQTRLEEILKTGVPAAPVLDPRSADRLRLTVAVRAYSSSELRGFYLPFSGTYGIGPVKLAVERMVTLPGVPAPVKAIVWQTERQARGIWRTSANEILGLVEELAEDFLDDYRRVLAP